MSTQPRSITLLRLVLDRLYLYSGYLAAVFLVIILLLIVAQMIARWSGAMIPGGADYAGYCMASASFFAFAYALNNGNHIRVTLLLNTLGRFRRIGEIWCFGIGTALAFYWTYFAIKATYWSHFLDDVSQGQDATPLWIPQLSMAIGSVVFTIALFDNFVRILLVGTHSAHAQVIESDTTRDIT